MTAGQPYRYPIEDCDVLDKTALAEYRAKRTQWLSWLSEDDVHSIWDQISAALWSDVAFRSIAQIGETFPEGALGNSLLASALIEGHFAGQVLIIRRLFDKRKDVISLRRLVNEIKASGLLLTRENYVCHDGLPYDFAKVEHETMLSRLQNGGGPWWAEQQGPKAHIPSQRLHAVFDRLSGVKPDARQRTDRIPDQVIDELESWLEEADAEDLITWSHKVLAHAADQTSRAAVNLNGLRPNLDKLQKVHRGMVRIAEAIGGYILGDSGHGMVVPVPQFNQFQYLSQPAMSEASLPTAHDFWHKLSKERDGWLEGTLDAMVARVPPT